MTRTIVNTASYIQDHMVKLTLAVIGMCVIVALFYVMNLHTLISRTLAIKQIENKIILVSSALSKLDSEYFALSNAITPDSMKQYGLSQGQISLYITRNQSLGRLGDSSGTVTNKLASLSHEL